MRGQYFMVGGARRACRHPTEVRGPANFTRISRVGERARSWVVMSPRQWQDGSMQLRFHRILGRARLSSNPSVGRARWHLVSSVLVCVAGCALKPGGSSENSDTTITVATESTGAQTTDFSLTTTTTVPEQPCSDAGEASTWAPGVPSTEDTCFEHPFTDACCCFRGDEGFAYNECPAAFVCPHVLETCKGDGIDACALAITCDQFVAIECALNALASGAPGALRWTLELDDQFEDTQLYMLGDGTAIVTTHTNAFDVDAQDAVVRLLVKPAEFFNDCKNLLTAVERFNCVQQALTGDAIEICLPASKAPDI